MPITDENELLRVKTSIIYLTATFFLGNTDPKKKTKGTLKAFSDF
jgi:hypothetical protein